MSRRMFSDDITTSDAFLEMPDSAQNLYFHLGMSADDDGFIGSHKMVMRMVRAGEDDYKILLAKRFILHFEKGICVIKHWRINNQIRKDRYTPTKYLTEKTSLFIKENGAYTQNNLKGLPVPKGHFTTKEIDNFESGNQLATIRQPSIGKVSIGKVSIEDTLPSKEFKKPTLKEVTDYCNERNNSVNPQRFIDHYESNGWKVGGKSSMKDWKASIRTWEKNSFGNQNKIQIYKNTNSDDMVEKLKSKQIN